MSTKPELSISYILAKPVSAYMVQDVLLLSQDDEKSNDDPLMKIIFGFLMIFGRLEIIAIIYIFVPKLGS